MPPFLPEYGWHEEHERHYQDGLGEQLADEIFDDFGIGYDYGGCGEFVEEGSGGHCCCWICLPITPI
eukprot:CAMPEP_0183758664 /NCGR_PEP_ID=MMETSP0739-20130205/6570_1 /TAXON_ID=385413 /ORGANISM="Thalassiosira miniscula, Strain CCMP1093" /LENGTH=66 /DNA_ID=CAMNT_0025996309 /DNA_START=611 /DNA_END=811 /DNA_ORIENTATION=+